MRAASTPHRGRQSRPPNGNSVAPRSPSPLPPSISRVTLACVDSLLLVTGEHNSLDHSGHLKPPRADRRRHDLRSIVDQQPELRFDPCSRRLRQERCAGRLRPLLLRGREPDGRRPRQWAFPLRALHPEHRSRPSVGRAVPTRSALRKAHPPAQWHEPVSQGADRATPQRAGNVTRSIHQAAMARSVLNW